MKTMKQKVIFAFVILLSVQNASAAPSCSEYLRKRLLQRNLLIYGFGTLISAGVWALPGVILFAFEQKVMGATPHRFAAAHILTHKSEYLPKKHKWAEKILRKFYIKFEPRTPDLNVGYNELIDVLDHIEQHGVDNGACIQMIRCGFGSFGRSCDDIADWHFSMYDYFNEVGLEKYYEMAHQIQRAREQTDQERQQKRTSAQQCRDRKNGRIPELPTAPNLGDQAN